MRASTDLARARPRAHRARARRYDHAGSRSRVQPRALRRPRQPRGAREQAPQPSRMAKALDAGIAAAIEAGLNAPALQFAPHRAHVEVSPRAATRAAACGRLEALTYRAAAGWSARRRPASASPARCRRPDGQVARESRRGDAPEVARSADEPSSPARPSTASEAETTSGSGRANLDATVRRSSSGRGRRWA